ncbi:MAG: beta-glucosidase [Ruminococcus sp.]|nr:beta-glucosidase [Ruminococcus sp.]
MSFRKDFAWGVATASYQIEGATYEDGKGLSVWDEFTHINGKILDNSTGDVACDHYHRYKEDVKLMAELGIKAYRFSICWPRIIPDGIGEVNQKGLDFYNSLIDELLKYGIEPYVTLYHWDLPYELHKKGGWLNSESVDWFEYYTSVFAKHFGDRVKNFITFNEPQVFINHGYSIGVHAPGYKVGNKELLQMCHNVLLAHGKAVRVLRNAIEGVNIGFVAASSPGIPVSDDDIEAAREKYFDCGKNHFIFADSFWFDPVVFGKYPEKVLKENADIFPEIADGDMEIISTPIDFIGLNIYSGHLVEKGENGGYRVVHPPVGNARTAVYWYVTPDALYWGSKFHNERYNLPVYITENGMSAHDVVSLDGKVHDPNRIDYLNRYLLGLKKAADEGVDVRGYFQWSLMDNFEWAQGYDERFGAVYVDFATQERIIKDSGYWYKEIIESNGEKL